jgi:FlaA1/EpsC-like NDP-sugar epimerase
MPYNSIFKPDLFSSQTIMVTGGGSGIGRNWYRWAQMLEVLRRAPADPQILLENSFALKQFSHI